MCSIQENLFNSRLNLRKETQNKEHHVKIVNKLY